MIYYGFWVKLNKIFEIFSYLILFINILFKIQVKFYCIYFNIKKY